MILMMKTTKTTFKVKLESRGRVVDLSDALPIGEAMARAREEVKARQYNVPDHAWKIYIESVTFSQ